MTGWDRHLLLLSLGTLVLLVLFTAVGQVLRARLGEGPMVANFNTRVKAWWGMAALLALAFMAGRSGVVLLFAACSFAALREFVTLTRFRRADHWAMVTAFFVVFPLHYYLVWIDWYGLYAIFIPVYGFLFLPIIAVLRSDTSDFLARIAETQWALMLCVFCLSHVPALLYLRIPGYEGGNVLLIAFLVVVVQFSDVMQYVWGKLLGRRRIAPGLSPSKTVEGFLGGVATATLAGAGLWWMTPFTVLQAGGLALVITLMGFLGGLVMSAIKRDRGVKDWGHLIPGHGGFIDRLDSVIFAAPIFFHLVRYWWSTA
ncbi:phosphatidate cytidylyltransferase [Paralimibaculum aggregatum]|uniref:Phosphatidate cytidylyltransferase n=1 Tax=Paralimibaculum aggregatum TaxID=3036245 RepID=A0ABQ6LFE2_9RHOB|nr:phosphatidate cytidylyltransferase [Limibaculum sp. NKW23]GMG82052.1 phosphatidate cytidylyltransferase [Limibaculum sp. NKW23]